MIISQDGKTNHEINNRVKKAANVYYQLHNAVIGKNEISYNTKMQIFNSVYLPTLTYGTESLIIGHREESRITSAEMKFLRRAAGKTRRDRIRNNTIRNEFRTTPLTDTIKSNCLKWYGHVKRMPERRLPKQLIETRPTGMRTRERPRKEWKDQIKEIAEEKGRSLRELEKLLKNKKEYNIWATRR